MNTDEDFEMQDEMYVGPEDIVGEKQNKTGCGTEGQNNDELLYDPNVDDDNENWMQKERQKHIPRGGKIFPITILFLININHYIRCNNLL